MGAIKELMSSYKDAHGEEPRSTEDMLAWKRREPKAHESMEGGKRPTTALAVIVSDLVALAIIVALAIVAIFIL